MRISDLMIMGLKNLSRRKARTALTVIGVVIGTISIVVMISIGIGMNESFRSQVMEQGSLTTIMVQRNALIRDEKGNYVDSVQQKMDDTLVESLKQLEHVKIVTPVISKNIMLKSGKYQANIYVYAMEPIAFQEFGFPALTYGEYPSEESPESIVLGVSSLYFYNPSSRFGEAKTIDPSKDRIKVSFDSNEYAVKKKKNMKPIVWKNFAMMEQTNADKDYMAYMDLKTFKKYYKDYIKTIEAKDRRKAEESIRNYEQIQIGVDNIKNVVSVQEEIKALGFRSDSLAQSLETMQKTSNMLQLVLGGVGAVAMLVSAISIANTMVMSIYERTKEIGVMKVLGCIVTDIEKLFLFEAAMIGLIGGVIGIAVSYLASFCINRFGAPLFQALLSSSFMYNSAETKFSVIPFWLPFLASGFAIGIGILSGYYPARRATKISAIEAMKTEG